MQTSVWSASLGSTTKDWGVSLLQVVGFALLTALCAKIQFYFPFSPVPITLQSFAVLLAGAVLGSRKAALSQISLILLGLSGLPVFTLPLPGLMTLMGPTGGYIFGFVGAAYLFGLWTETGRLRSLAGLLTALVTSHIALFLPGLLWLSFFVPGGAEAVLMAGLWPFLPGAVVKSLALLLVLRGLGKIQSSKA